MEYGLGVAPETYAEEASDDPKAVLDGLSVASLVALLRQFGDLSKFAAEVFHGLQEQMSTTASRSRTLMTRMKNVEASLPPLEKAILSQTSHLQFAYTSGFEWHARIEDERNHFLYTDLPPCLMDSYEECREPPRLQLLDKFDPGGPGSCLKRYSDPNFVRKISRNPHVTNNHKSNKERKARETKKRSRKQSSCQYDASNFDFTDQQRSYSPRQLHQSSPTQTASTSDNAFKFDLEDQSDSLGSGDGIGLTECIPRPSASKNPEGGPTTVLSHDNYRRSILEKNGLNSSTDTPDGNVEIVEPMVLNHGMQELPSLNATSSEFERQEIEPRMWEIGNGEADIEPGRWNSRSYHAPQVPETNCEVDNLDIKPMARLSRIKGTPEIHDLHREVHVRSVDTNPEVPGTNLQDNDQVKGPDIQESPNVTCTSFEGVDTPSFIFHLNQPDETESDTENFVDALNSIESESENDLDFQAKTDVKFCSYPGDGLEDGMDNELTADTSYNGSGKGKFSKLRCSTDSPLLSCEDPSQHNSASFDISGDAPRQSIQSSFVEHDSSGIGNTNFKQPTLVSDDHDVDSYKNLNNSAVSAHSRVQRVPTVIHPEAKDQCAADVRSSLDGAPSFLSGFPNRAQINSFRRTTSMEYNEKPKALGCEKICDDASGAPVSLHSSFSRISLTEEPPSHMTSAPGSPLLEHMKISFQSINNFETAKLQLRQPEGIEHHSEASDAFPPFQLVPEPDSQPRFNSDTDDDTFCRSNHFISDDDISHHSGPNSELWGSPDSSESRDNIPRNTFCRASSGGSMSSSTEDKQTTNMGIHNGHGSSRAQNMVDLLHTSSSHLRDVPLLEAVNPFGFQEPTPELPPLPPLQWRVTKPLSDALENKGSALHLTTSLSNSKNNGSMFPRPTKPAPSVQINTGTEPMDTTVINKKLDGQKLKVNVQVKTNQEATQRSLDEREDFLHQIRTKSFNLRKTGLLKPSPAVSPVASVQVAAILEKAKTIRQVMTSDDGEDDDSWSDT